MTEHTEIHQGVFVSILGYGVFITGKAASGKSSFALELLNQGHKLIADDVVEFQLDKANNIIGRCPQMLNGMLHHRELGIIMVKQIFGEHANPEQHRLDYIVQLSEEHQDPTGLNPPQKNHVIQQRSFPLLLLNKNNLTTLTHRLTTWLQMQQLEDGAEKLQHRQSIVMAQQ